MEDLLQTAMRQSGLARPFKRRRRRQAPSPAVRTVQRYSSSISALDHQWREIASELKWVHLSQWRQQINDDGQVIEWTVPQMDLKNERGVFVDLQTPLAKRMGSPDKAAIVGCAQFVCAISTPDKMDVHLVLQWIAFAVRYPTRVLLVYVKNGLDVPSSFSDIWFKPKILNKCSGLKIVNSSFIYE